MCKINIDSFSFVEQIIDYSFFNLRRQLDQHMLLSLFFSFLLWQILVAENTSRVRT